MKFGCIIRSTGERTENLCYQSVAQHLDTSQIDIVKNVAPFWKAVESMLLLAQGKGYDWYLGLDADVVLIKNWRAVLEKILKEQNADTCYKVEFAVFDRFILESFYGIHLYNNRFTSEALRAIQITKNHTKPEGNMRHYVSGNRTREVTINAVLGCHGYEQWKRDIFNRFALRANRTPGFAKKYDLFRRCDTEELLIAKAGWDYGKDHNISTFMDCRKKIEVKDEFDALAMGLDGFYIKHDLEKVCQM